MRGLLAVAMGLGMVGLVSGAALADDKDVIGTWKWTNMGKGGKGGKTETTLKIKAEGGKLTGTVSSSFGGKDLETKIEDVKYKDGELSFSVTREFKDQKFTTKYSGKVTGDTIKGSTEGSFGGKDFKRDWEAKKAVVKD